MAAERPLAGGFNGPVSRVGETVRRSAGPWTPTVHSLLSHLRARGFTLAPRPLGYDERGREVLSYLEGQVPLYPLPEWCWRDFRLRLSQGRNHGPPARLERAALLWAVYRNFTPAQERSECKRHYRHPGQSPLAVAGVPPDEVSYLDALAV